MAGKMNYFANIGWSQCKFEKIKECDRFILAKRFRLKTGGCSIIIVCIRWFDDEKRDWRLPVLCDIAADDPFNRLLQILMI